MSELAAWGPEIEEVNTPDYPPGILKYLDQVSPNQYFVADKLKARWKYYDHVPPSYEFDFYKDPINMLKLVGRYNRDSVVLDVGCSTGEDLLTMQSKRRHRGQLIGVDISPRLFEDTLAKSKQPLQLIEGVAQSLPLPNDSVDVATAIFMLYHAPDALAELKRVLKPGGTLVAATSGPDNKRMHRQIEDLSAVLLDVEPPRRFNSKFNNENAEPQLDEFFAIDPTMTKHQFIGARFDHTNYHVYLESLYTMHNACTPSVPREVWIAAVNQVAIPRIVAAISKYGYFEDIVDRTMYICFNEK